MPKDPLLQRAAPDEETQNATRAIFELLRDHEGRINAMTTHAYTVAQQVTELTMNMKDMEARIPGLMAEGFASAVSNPATWAAGKAAMREAAQQAAGGWVLGACRFLLDKAIWGGLFLLAVYWVGGMPALASFLKLKWSAP